MSRGAPAESADEVGCAVVADDPALLTESCPAAAPNAAAHAPTWRTDTLAESVVILLVLSVVQRLVGFGRQVLVCRWLEPSQLGQWDIAFKFLMLAAPVSVLGLPGSFGRYLEHYRQRGHLKTFLRRTAMACLLLSCTAVLVLGSMRTWASELLYGSPNQTEMVLVLAGSLIGVVAYNYLNDVFTALRMVRVTSIVQFWNGLLFAVLSVGLLIGWRHDATAIVVAFALSYLVLFALAAVWFRRTWRGIPEPAERLPQAEFWSKLLPFAVCVWSVNLLYNLIGVVDRYMLIHFAKTSDPLTLVGNYHSSQVVPMLMVSVSGILGAIIMPHLSHDWESGRREAVSTRLNLAIKLLGLAMLAGSALTLLAAPLLFGVAFHGKYDDGLAILPWTLTYCIWMALVPLAQMYLWCTERARLSTLALVAGLVVNVALCLVLLPRFGLPGVAWASAAANLVTLVLMYTFNRLNGMSLDAGVWLVTLLPFTLGVDTFAALAVTVAMVVAIFISDRVLTREEKALLLQAYRRHAIRTR